MAPENRRRNSFECTERIHGIDRSRSAGSVQVNTPTYQTTTMASSASPIHSHDVAYGDGPITNWSTSSGTGEHLGHPDQSRTDLRAAADGCVGYRIRGHELFEFTPPLLLGAAVGRHHARTEVGAADHETPGRDVVSVSIGVGRPDRGDVGDHRPHHVVASREATDRVLETAVRLELVGDHHDQHPVA